MLRWMRPLLLCGCVAACTPALAEEVLGIYVGAGVGRTDLRQDDYQIDGHATGWKLLAGWRPLSLVGVEAEYTDLGSRSVTTDGGATHVSTNAKAAAAYVVGYLPVPLPWIDVYGKVGAAKVKANTSAYCTQCLAKPPDFDSSKSGVAFGAGVQLKSGRWAARLDYERFDGSHGDPALLAAEFLVNF
ncbi:MAG TPA: porin family protein [Steroidobacteraceae bacterium]|jgi:hypothetical protein